MASGTASDAVAKDRYYDNLYPDFDPQIPNNFIVEDKNTYQITEAFATRIQNTAESILQTIKSNEKNVLTSGFSVYTGIAGVAMVHMFAGRRLGGNYAEVAKSLIKVALDNRHRSRENFLNGNSGVFVLNALIRESSEARELLNQQLTKMVKQVKQANTDIPNELLYGRVGFLYSFLSTKKNGLPHSLSVQDIRDIISQIIHEGRALSKSERCKAPLKFKWHEKNYYGAAHGTAGILYLLLQAKEFIDERDLSNLIKPTIDDLLGQRFKSGNLLSSEGSTTDRLVQWCHGSPGAVQLFCLAYEIFGDRSYLDAAVLCGEVVWRRGLLRKGCGLCHGTAGNAYTFISLYQLFKTQSEFSEEEAAKHLYRACAFAEWCFEFTKHQERHADRYFSLFEGLSGTAYFLIDLLHPMKAAFPGYTVQSL